MAIARETEEDFESASKGFLTIAANIIEDCRYDLQNQINFPSPQVASCLALSLECKVKAKLKGHGCPFPPIHDFNVLLGYLPEFDGKDELRHICSRVAPFSVSGKYLSAANLGISYKDVLKMYYDVLKCNSILDNLVFSEEFCEFDCTHTKSFSRKLFLKNTFKTMVIGCSNLRIPRKRRDRDSL